MLVTNEPPGANCASGGLRVDTGLDSNNDGILETGEVQHTAYVCAVASSGAAGAGGAPVDAGRDGPPATGGMAGSDAGAGGAGGSAGSGGAAGAISCASSPGALIDIEPLTGDTSSSGFGIDDRGNVLAISSGPSCSTCPGPRPFFWQPNLRNQLFGSGAGSLARVTAMNHSGRVVGTDNISCATCFLAWDAPSPFPTSFGTGPAIDTAQVTGVGDNGAPFGNGRVQRGCSMCFHAITWPPSLGNSVTDLGTIDGVSTTGSTASAMNSLGQVVGSSGGRAVLWAPLIRDLGNLGAGGASAVDLNDATDVVGSSVTASGKTHAFLWRAGAMQDLGTLQGGFSQAVAINADGDVIGNSDGHAFVWRSGAMIDLGTLGGTSSTAVAINDAGQVIGNSVTAAGTTHPFLWQNGVMTDLGTLGGATSTATAINASGMVVGTSNTATGNSHAFLACPPIASGGSTGSGGPGGGAGAVGGVAGAGGGSGTGG